MVLALIPDPHQLGVVTAAAPVVDGQLRKKTSGASKSGERHTRQVVCLRLTYLLSRAQASAVLTAPSLGLSPSSVVHAAAHALIRAAANAKIRVECPPKLRASEK